MAWNYSKCANSQTKSSFIFSIYPSYSSQIIQNQIFFQVILFFSDTFIIPSVVGGLVCKGILSLVPLLTKCVKSCPGAEDMNKLIAKKEQDFLFLHCCQKNWSKTSSKICQRNFKKFTIVIHKIRISRNTQVAKWSQPVTLFSFFMQRSLR